MKTKQSTAPNKEQNLGFVRVFQSYGKMLRTKNTKDAPQDSLNLNIPKHDYYRKQEEPEMGNRASLEQNTWSYETQDLIDTLPKTWTRALLYILIGFVCIALPWSILFKFDDIKAARGKIEPEGGSHPIDAPFGGVVKAINVEEGETVIAGQSLLQLDSTVIEAELEQNQIRLDSLLEQESSLLRKRQAQKVEHQAQIRQNEQQIQFHQKELDRSEAQNEHIDALRELQRQRIISHSELQRTVAPAEKQLDQTRSDLSQSQSEKSKQDSIYQQKYEDLQAQLKTTQGEITQIHSKIRQLQYQLEQQAVPATTNGKVLALTIQHPGAVVQVGQRLGSIAPEDKPLVLRAQVATQESGGLRINMPVKLKFDAYPFQDYGIVEGKISWISPDSKSSTDQQPEVFEIEIKLDQSCIKLATGCIPLKTGDTAAAEIISRQRRVIDFLLDPFMKLQKGGVNL
jgi:hemolysin D